jgi:hypothetical protein
MHGSNKCIPQLWITDFLFILSCIYVSYFPVHGFNWYLLYSICWLIWYLHSGFDDNGRAEMTSTTCSAWWRRGELGFKTATSKQGWCCHRRINFADLFSVLLWLDPRLVRINLNLMPNFIGFELERLRLFFILLRRHKEEEERQKKMLIFIYRNIGHRSLGTCSRYVY